LNSGEPLDGDDVQSVAALHLARSRNRLASELARHGVPVHAVGLLDDGPLPQPPVAVDNDGFAVVEGAVRVVVAQRLRSSVVTRPVERLLRPAEQVVGERLPLESLHVVQGDQVSVVSPGQAPVLTDCRAQTVAVEPGEPFPIRNLTPDNEDVSAAGVPLKAERRPSQHQLRGLRLAPRLAVVFRISPKQSPQ